jgi:type IV secretion system protein VirB4
MIFKSKKKTEDNSFKFTTIDPGFIPYACHYDPNTIVTKNGELLQTIKLVGFSFEKIEASLVDLRSIIRKAIAENVTSANLAIWVHTVRRRKNLDQGGKFPNNFSIKAHKAWSNKNYWNDKYVNELYITLIHQGTSLSLSNIKDVIAGIFFGIERNIQRRALNQAFQHLNSTVEQMLVTLKEYGAKRLTIYENNEGVFSEPLQFLGKLVHLHEEPMPVPIVDLSSYLATNYIAFGNESLEIIGKNGKHFAAILSIKEYKEMPPQSLDDFIQLPLEFIITQSIVFNEDRKFLTHIKLQDYYFEISNEKDLSKVAGIDVLLEEDDSPTAYANNQMTVMFFSDTVAKLEFDLKRGTKALNKLGAIVIREDLNLEALFWAQLPGNFTFICRNQEIIKITQAAGFASLHNFPAGAFHNPWGDAVTIIRTSRGTPYFFNFHIGDNGHTAIIGPDGTGKTTLLNFLLSESQKYSPRLLHLDFKGHSTKFIQTINGKTYKALLMQGNECRFNPFILPESPENKQLVDKWIEFTLLNKDSTDEEKALTKELIVKFPHLPADKRNYHGLRDILISYPSSNLVETVKQRLELWLQADKYGSLIDSGNDAFASFEKILSFDLSNLKNEALVVIQPVLSYIFHRFYQTLDGTPTILAIDDSFSLFKNEHFIQEYLNWLDLCKTKNCIIVTASNFETNENTKIDSFFDKMATRVFVTNPLIDERFQERFHLSRKEYNHLKSFKLINRNILLKHGEDSIIAELNLAGLEEIIEVLSSK